MKKQSSMPEYLEDQSSNNDDKDKDSQSHADTVAKKLIGKLESITENIEDATRKESLMEDEDDELTFFSSSSSEYLFLSYYLNT